MAHFFKQYINCIVILVSIMLVSIILNFFPILNSQSFKLFIFVPPYLFSIKFYLISFVCILFSSKRVADMFLFALVNISRFMDISVISTWAEASVIVLFYSMLFCMFCFLTSPETWGC